MRYFKKTALSIALGLSFSGSGFAGAMITYDPTTAGLVTSTLDKLQQAINQIGASADQQSSISSAIADSTNAAQTQNAQGIVLATDTIAALNTYGAQGSDAATSSVLCVPANAGMAAAIQQGRVNMQSTQSSNSAKMEKRARTKGKGAGGASDAGGAAGGSVNQVNDILPPSQGGNGVEETEIISDNIYPASRTLTKAKQEPIVSNINTKLIDPLPPTQLNDNLKSTTRGKSYEATRLLYEMNKEAPRNAQSVVLSMKASDFPVNQWALDAWKDINTSLDPGAPAVSFDPNSPPGIDPTNNNQMSYDAFIQLFVKSRIDNDNWYKKAVGAAGDGSGGNEVWQLRQINLNTAMLLEIQYQQLQISKNILELLAQERATNIDKEYLPQLDKLKTDTAMTRATSGSGSAGSAPVIP